VAELLDQPPAWPRNPSLRELESLEAELEAFVKEQGLPPRMLPTASTLSDAGRHDLLNAITRAGEGYAL